jgi:formiminoglutamase
MRRFARLFARSPRVKSIDLAEVDSALDSADGRTVRLTALCVLEALAGLAER